RNLILNGSRQVLNVPYSYTRFKWRSILFYGLVNITLIAAAALSLRAIRRRLQVVPPVPLLLAWFSLTTFAIHTAVGAEARMFVEIVPALAGIVLYGARYSLRAQTAKSAPALRWREMAI